MNRHAIRWIPVATYGQNHHPKTLFPCEVIDLILEGILQGVVINTSEWFVLEFVEGPPRQQEVLEPAASLPAAA
jgi:hypothetical protein